MAKKYITTDKTGEEVEVSRELAKQLIDSGKKLMHPEMVTLRNCFCQLGGQALPGLQCAFCLESSSNCHHGSTILHSVQAGNSSCNAGGSFDGDHVIV